jgi:hypothetical protein
VAWSLWTVAVVTMAALLWLGFEGAGEWSTIAGGLFILAFATTGALVASHRPENPVGWLLCLTALAFTIGGVCVGVSEYAVREQRDNLVAATVAAWVGAFVWMIGVGVAATFVLLLFPDGHLPSRRWRPVAWLAGTSLCLTTTGLALSPGRIEDTRVTNPVGLTAADTVLAAAVATGLALLGVSILASCLSLAVRFRNAGREQRQQLKWIAYTLPLVVLWMAASAVVESTHSGNAAVEIANTLVSIGLTVVPVSIGVAMLRHRLYDIDVVINRTLVYGALTATLAAAYLGSVLVLQQVLNPLTAQSDLAVAVSTLAVAALFRPARARIQGAVDRRFYRRRYDAARTLESFTGRLRDEVDLGSVSTDLRGVVHDTMQPVQVSLWLRSPGSAP